MYERGRMNTGLLNTVNPSADIMLHALRMKMSQIFLPALGLLRRHHFPRFDCYAARRPFLPCPPIQTTFVALLRRSEIERTRALGGEDCLEVYSISFQVCPVVLLLLPLRDAVELPWLHSDSDTESHKYPRSRCPDAKAIDKHFLVAERDIGRECAHRSVKGARIA